MSSPKISIVASSVRHWLWMEFMRSLQSNKVTFEVVFAGDLDPFQTRFYQKEFPELKYVHCARIKPAQCYQVAMMEARGKLILWACDDAEFEPNLLDKAYENWTSFNDEKTILSLQTNEDGKRAGAEIHTLLGWNVNTPLMAPIALLSREWVLELGGFHNEYISGQWENEFVMRAYANGSKVHVFKEAEVEIAHRTKHKTDNNPFWSAYVHDRTILENTFVVGGYKPETPIIKMPGEYARDGKEFLFKVLDNRKVVLERQTPFLPYVEENIKTINQGPAGIWTQEPS